MKANVRNYLLSLFIDDVNDTHDDHSDIASRKEFDYMYGLWQDTAAELGVDLQKVIKKAELIHGPLPRPEVGT